MPIHGQPPGWAGDDGEVYGREPLYNPAPSAWGVAMTRFAWCRMCSPAQQVLAAGN